MPDIPAAMPATETFVRAVNICKTFGSVSVLGGVSLDILPGELIVILGPSGCGKTTLLRIIAGLERQDSGTVIINNRDVSNDPPALRRCGIVFQSYALFPNLSVESNIGFGMDRWTTTRQQRRLRVAELLDLIGLPQIASKYPAQLSGGQQQRVALARALAVNPSILLLDEPLSALDAKVRARLRGEIRAIQQRLKLTTIMVTHDQEEALTMADRVVVMDQGSISQTGLPQEIYRWPATAAVGAFVGAMNVLPGWVATGDRIVSRDNHSLELVGNGVAVGTPIHICFRPEEARIVAMGQTRPANCLPAEIIRTEFRGPVTRVYLTILGDPVMVDAPFEQVRDSDGSVYIHIPASNLRMFYSGGEAE
jgi:iron(III) transport system ATP-binding protein